MVSKRETFIAEDGKEFDSELAALEYEVKLKNRTEESYKKYFTTYAGKRLLEQHSLTEYGIWEVRGEDPNPDLGGPHHEPKLGKVEGKLEDVIRWAVAQPNFWQWGAGGSIKRTDNEKIIKL